MNNRFKKSTTKRSPQNMEFDARGVPTRNTSRCQKSWKINAKPVTKQIRKSIENNVSVKTLNFIVKTIAFDCLQGFMCER